MKNFIFPILLLFCLASGFIYVLTNTPFLMNFIIPDIINRKVNDVHVEYFRCASQQSQLPDILTMKDIQMTFRKGERLFDVKAEVVTIHNFFEFVKKQEVLYISGSGVSLDTKPIIAKDAKFKFVFGLNDWDITFGEGIVFSGVFHIGPYTFQQINAGVKGDKKGVEILDIKGIFYGGETTGKITFDFKPRFGYALWSEFVGVQSQSVQSPYPEFFSRIQGALNGSVRVVGSDQVDIFTIILDSSKELIIAPEIFLRMKGVFTAEEEAELKRLSEAGAFLKATKAALHIQNSHNQRMMLVFDIEEAENRNVLKGRYPLVWNAGWDTFLFPSLAP